MNIRPQEPAQAAIDEAMVQVRDDATGLQHYTSLGP